MIFLFTNMVYLFMIFITIPKVMSYAKGMKIFDMMPTGYSLDYARELVTVLGPDGRKTYLFTQLPVDMIYPFLFGLTYSLMIAYFINKLRWFDKPILYMSILPILAGLFDYLENIGIIIMLNSHQDLSLLLVGLSNWFTITKSVLSTISFTFLLILLFTFLVRKKSRSQPSG